MFNLIKKFLQKRRDKRAEEIKKSIEFVTMPPSPLPPPPPFACTRCGHVDEHKFIATTRNILGYGDPGELYECAECGDRFESFQR